MQMEYITHATDAAELIRTKRSSPTLFKAFINITAAAASPLPKLPPMAASPLLIDPIDRE
jgi:hypothetical protein